VSETSSRNDASRFNILINIQRLDRSRLGPAREEATLLAAAGSVVVVRAGTVRLLLAVVHPLEDVHEEGEKHETGTSDSAGEDGSVETGGEAKVGACWAGSGGETITDGCTNVASAAVSTSAVEDSDGDEAAHDEKVTDHSKNGEEGPATEATSHEGCEESVDDSTASHAFDSLGLLVDALMMILIFGYKWNVSEEWRRHTRSW